MPEGMDGIDKHLICPDCSTTLKVKKNLECPACGRIFLVNGRIINLLPSYLSESDLAEERFWATDSREGIEAPAWLALLVVKDRILHFYEKILPKLELHGRVLEIGSGSCWLSALIKSAFPETTVIASDIAYSALVKGVQVGGLLDSKVDYLIACKVERLPFENEFFDYVIGSAILHHTSPRQALREVFRVLRNGGQYIGVGELAISKPLGFVWGRFGLPGKREREVGVIEGNYSLNQWREFFNEAGFNDVEFSFERDPEYKQYHWLVNLYYKSISRLPEMLVRHALACSLGIVAKKNVKR